MVIETLQGDEGEEGTEKGVWFIASIGLYFFLLMLFSSLKWMFSMIYLV